MEINGWKFPERVWEKTSNGWYSRPATMEDIEGRRKFVEAMNRKRAEAA